MPYSTITQSTISKLIETLTSSPQHIFNGEQLANDLNISATRLKKLIQDIGTREYDTEEKCGTPGCRWRKNKQHYWCCRLGKDSDNEYIYPVNEGIFKPSNKNEIKPPLRKRVKYNNNKDIEVQQDLLSPSMSFSPPLFPTLSPLLSNSSILPPQETESMLPQQETEQLPFSSTTLPPLLSNTEIIPSTEGTPSSLQDESNLSTTTTTFSTTQQKEETTIMINPLNDPQSQAMLKGLLLDNSGWNTQPNFNNNNNNNNNLMQMLFMTQCQYQQQLREQQQQHNKHMECMMEQQKEIISQQGKLVEYIVKKQQ